MAWSTTVTYKRIEYQKKPLRQYRRTVFGVYRLYKATRTITVDEADGLKQAKADSTAAAVASETVTAKSIRSNDANGYKVVKTSDSQTEWTLVTPDT
jgi:hypothetical protein